MAKKMRLGQRYSRMMTRSYIPFVIYVAIFATLIILTSSSIKTNIVQTYKAAIHESDATILIDKEIQIHSNIIYIYADKNQNLYKFKINETKQTDGNTYVSVQDPEILLNLLTEFRDKQINVEIPGRKISLLRKMIPLGDINQ